ncbi:MAG TPA: hypothetical protein H9740_02365 [Candidatus Hungatella pullicola]|nr:hypothetical protein [Candidatus Hungatella pullicola]
MKYYTTLCVEMKAMLTIVLKKIMKMLRYMGGDTGIDKKRGYGKIEKTTAINIRKRRS